MTRVHIWGASGYAAAEAIRYLEAHPHVTIVTLESRSHAGAALADVFPLLRASAHHFDESGATLARVAAGDVVMTAGAHNEARSIVPSLLVLGARVIDLSADYRFDANAVYGFPEQYREQIADARLVANPGCYPTATLLAALPLRRIGTPTQLIVDAKSGITGAGRAPSVASLFAEVSGDIRPYGLGGHRHQPEIEAQMAALDLHAPLVFTPHVVPIARGMLVDLYAVFDRTLDPLAVAEAYAQAYASNPFVRVLSADRTPSVPAVVGTNDAELRVDVIGSTVRVICAIDNLGKGAAGAAVANLNIMLGYPEETGLHARAILA